MGAPSIGEGMEAWQTAVTPVPCHTWLTAAPSSVVTSRAKRTFGVAIAGQAAVPLPVPVKSFPAPLAVNAPSVVTAVEAAESISCQSVKFLIKDALPGLSVAITDWRPGVGPGCRQEEREAEAAAEPERRHGQAGPRCPPLQGSCPAPRRWELSLCAPLCFPFP